MKEFNERLKELRKASGLTQSDLAEKVNVHLQTVSKWERGMFQPDLSHSGTSWKGYQARVSVEGQTFQKQCCGNCLMSCQVMCNA